MYFKSIHTLQKGFVQLQSQNEIKGILLFGCDKNRPLETELKEVLKLNTKPLIGGIFPEILADGERKDEGFVVLPLFQDLKVLLFETKEDEFITNQLSTQFSTVQKDFSGVFCFVNTFWSEKTTFINGLYDELGPFVQYLGGGAGSLNFESFPCVIANQNIYEKAAVIGLFNNDITLGVAHGWKEISDPIKVTSTLGNTILSLDWKPALDVYKLHVEAHSKQDFANCNFFDLAKSYPIGLLQLEGEMIIRDPYEVKDDELQLIDEVPEGEYIRIMHGNMHTLLLGAQHAVEMSVKQNHTYFTQFCIDCISRVLFMGDDFDKELHYLNKYQKANGILCIGEIANTKNSVLEILNKTIVVAQWKEIN